VTQEDSSSSAKPASASKVYKAIIALGVAGDAEDVERFTVMWMLEAENRAHELKSTYFPQLTLLPLPEESNE